MDWLRIVGIGLVLSLTVGCARYNYYNRTPEEIAESKRELKIKDEIILGLRNKDGTLKPMKYMSRTPVKDMMARYRKRKHIRENEPQRVLKKYPRLIPWVKMLGMPKFKSLLVKMMEKGKRMEDYLGEPSSPIVREVPTENSINPELLRMVDQDSVRSM